MSEKRHPFSHARAAARRQDLPVCISAVTGTRIASLPSPVIRSRKILIVDDSEICREVVRFVLEARGHKVIPLDSPFGLAAALGRERPDLVLVDVSMPALDGHKLVEVTLRHDLYRCPIVLYSDRSTDELAELVRASGAVGFIQKTADSDQLARSVEAFLQDD
ncbi:MAG TPA: response regulator [Polyangia bacterium]|nr:response regulator [Polyangia bacterium]